MAQFSEEFGVAVRRWLAARDLSIQEAARKAEGTVSYGTIRNASLGIIPTADLIVEIAEVIGNNPSDRAACADELLEKGRKRLRYAGVRVIRGTFAGKRPAAGVPA